MGKKVLFAGSFDPPTIGHIDIIKRALLTFEELIIGVAKNSRKKHSTFTFLEKQALIKESLKPLEIQVVEINGLVAEYAKHHGFNYLLRSIRSTNDFESEMQLCVANKKLCGIETLFFIADPKYSHISSSLIHEIAQNGYRLNDFVDSKVEDAVYMKIAMQALS